MYSQARDPRRMERNKHIKLKTKRETKMMTTIEPGKSILTDLSFFYLPWSTMESWGETAGVKT